MENLLRQAHIHVRRQNMPAARELCTQALSMDPGSPVAHETMGLVLEAEGDDLGAYREYRAACETNPKPPEAEARLARLVIRFPPETLALLQPSTARVERELPPETEALLAAKLPLVNATLANAAVLRAMPQKQRAKVPAFASLVVPGLGQLIQRRLVKASIMFVIWLMCVTALAAQLPASLTGHTLQLSDPFLLGPLFILIGDYLCSILDAGMAEHDH